jgi:alcohol dehydrogenase class IV
MERMNPFEFATATRIIFGKDTADQVADIISASAFGRRALLVTSGQSSAVAADRLEQQLRDKGIQVTRYVVLSEPDVEIVEEGVRAAQSAGCDHVIALGGGSVIDTGKAIAGLLTNGGSVLDYVEVVGHGLPIRQPAAPLIALPTTAGTGAEVTRNAVIAVHERQVKVSMRSPYLLPRVAVVDPVPTYTMPPAVTASTGLDALTQLIEPFTSVRRNPLIDGVAEAGLKRAARSLLAAYREGTPAAREDMAFASLCGGLALANAGLGAAHGFAAVLGGRYPIAHGVCCAALLPHVIKGNMEALLKREPDSEVLDRYKTVAAYVTDTPRDSFKTHQDVKSALVEKVSGLCEALRIPKLSTCGVTMDAVPELVVQAQQASSMKANPLKLTAEELTEMLVAAI